MVVEWICRDSTTAAMSREESRSCSERGGQRIPAGLFCRRRTAWQANATSDLLAADHDREQRRKSSPGDQETIRSSSRLPSRLLKQIKKIEGIENCSARAVHYNKSIYTVLPSTLSQTAEAVPLAEE